MKSNPLRWSDVLVSIVAPAIMIGFVMLTLYGCIPK